MLDMGGASMQIAYELDSDEGVPSNLTTSFTLKGSTPDLYKKYNVYVVSYLNYGANVIRTKGKEIVQTLVPRDIDDFRIPDKTEHTYQVHFQGTGNSEECTNLIKPLFHKRNDCTPIPCAIGNTVQPLFNTRQMAFFGLTEYNYSMTDILSSEIYSYEEAVRQTKILCAKPWDEYVDYLRKKHPNKTEKEYVCFKAPFVISTLHTGLNFPLDYKNLRVVIDLEDTEVQWNWGALFYMLNSEPFADNMRPSLVEILLEVFGILFVTAMILLMLGLFLRQRLHKARDSSPSIPDNMETGIVQADQCQRQFVHQLSEEHPQQGEHPNCSNQNKDHPANAAKIQGTRVPAKQDHNQCYRSQTSQGPHHSVYSINTQSEPRRTSTDGEVHNRNTEQDVVSRDE
ncbi:hypothetical protein P879_00884 [Paragonimus westermani]|uniref:Uncharacterized protein n=1 Tax=Paragonimus westermani TaxID=34504 RepID=A0A8T0DPR0_9TREM|nr:hypothetical protein P879_00884 [Paragonimus westermani]